MTDLLERVPVRLGVFVAGLLVIFVAGYGIGVVTAGEPAVDPPVEREHDRPADHGAAADATVEIPVGEGS